jgi:hypothetical protein
MNRWLTGRAIVLLLTIGAVAQDPLKVAPQNYQLEFENGWVKALRVHYGAREKIVAHDHPDVGAAYVYLNDSGKVAFKHIGLSYGAITRPETKAGSFRLYRAVKEVHEAENLGDVPSDFLRIEFKTEPLNDKTLRGKFYREEVPAGENFQRVQFENEQIRVTRLICAPGKKCELTTDATEPALLVALTSAQFKSWGKLKKWNPEPGKTAWLEAAQKSVLENKGKEPAELLRFDFRSKPMKTKPEDKPHAHPHE